MLCQPSHEFETSELQVFRWCTMHRRAISEGRAVQRCVGARSGSIWRRCRSRRWSTLDAALARRQDGPSPDLARWGAWTGMAADLTRLRSRLLFRADAPDAKTAANGAEALRRPSVARAQMDASADWLDRRPQLGQNVHKRSKSELRRAGRRVDVTELLRACLVALHVPEPGAASRPKPPALWTMAEAIARVDQMSATTHGPMPLLALVPKIGGEGSPRELRRRAAVATTLLAGLE